MHVYNPTIPRKFISTQVIIFRIRSNHNSLCNNFNFFHLHYLDVAFAKGQQASLNSSDTLIKVLVGDAIKALEKDNTTKMLQNLNVVNQMLMDIKENSSSAQAMKLLLHDAIQAFTIVMLAEHLVYLNLVGEQFGIQQSKSEASNKVTAGVSNATNSDFLTYEHPILGTTMQYPHDWKVRQYEYNPSGNNTLAGFYSPSKTASELGNISGVSGHFIPYSDIFVFDSKNLTLDEIMSGRLNRLQNDTHFTAIESKPFTFNNGQPAWSSFIEQQLEGMNSSRKYKFILFIVTKYFLSASLRKMHHFLVTYQQSKK